MEEIWKEIKDTDGRYSVSNLGRVRRNEYTTTWKGGVRKEQSFKRTFKEEILPQYGWSTNKRQGKDKFYYIVQFTVNHKQKRFYVHRLVAEAFLNKPEGCNYVNHKDEDGHNNNVNNLEWVTNSENRLYSEELRRQEKENER